MSCQINGDTFNFSGSSGTLALTNNLWNVAALHLTNTTTSPTVYIYNNTFYKGSAKFIQVLNQPCPWTIKDNLFYQSSLTQLGNMIAADYNGYYTGFTRLYPTGICDKASLSGTIFAVGKLGSFYLASSTGPLISQGSQAASIATLYHYTTQTAASSREGLTQVDTGFHYVATDANGLPLDNDNDKLPDYYENRAGDGAINNDSESNWQSADFDADGMSDYTELVFGTSSRSQGTTDGQSLINLSITTPFK
jgi:hypothetical protein